jgi:hypothetical protein
MRIRRVQVSYPLSAGPLNGLEQDGRSMSLGRIRHKMIKALRIDQIGFVLQKKRSVAEPVDSVMLFELLHPTLNLRKIASGVSLESTQPPDGFNYCFGRRLQKQIVNFA